METTEITGTSEDTTIITSEDTTIITGDVYMDYLTELVLGNPRALSGIFFTLNRFMRSRSTQIDVFAM